MDTCLGPPFRADHVGSLLRPTRLVDARARLQRGEINADQLRAIEDEVIRALVAKQESIGLQAITDGEARRDFWHIDFLSQLEGVSTIESTDAGMKFKTAVQSKVLETTGRVRCTRPIMAEDCAFLGSLTSRTAKQTIPSPSVLYMRGGRRSVSASVYPDIDVFWRDLAIAYVLGSMDPAERRAFEVRLAADPAGRAEVAAFRATLDALGHAVPQVEPSARLRARILEAIDRKSTRLNSSPLVI